MKLFGDDQEEEREKKRERGGKEEERGRIYSHSAKLVLYTYTYFLLDLYLLTRTLMRLHSLHCSPSRAKISTRHSLQAHRRRRRGEGGDEERKDDGDI